MTYEYAISIDTPTNLIVRGARAALAGVGPYVEGGRLDKDAWNESNVLCFDNCLDATEIIPGGSTICGAMPGSKRWINRTTRQSDFAYYINRDRA